MCVLVQVVRSGRKEDKKVGVTIVKQSRISSMYVCTSDVISVSVTYVQSKAKEE